VVAAIVQATAGILRPAATALVIPALTVPTGKRAEVVTSIRDQARQPILGRDRKVESDRPTPTQDKTAYQILT
jgi:hypothetical protein